MKRILALSMAILLLGMLFPVTIPGFISDALSDETDSPIGFLQILNLEVSMVKREWIQTDPHAVERWVISSLTGSLVVTFFHLQITQCIYFFTMKAKHSSQEFLLTGRALL